MTPDNEQHILDAIVNGTFDNVTEEIPHTTTQEHQTNNPDPGTSFEFEIPPADIHDHETDVPATTFQFEPGSSSSRYNYVTKEHMEELFGIYKQHLVSEVSNLYDNLKADMVQESRNHEARYQTILDNQTQLFEQQKQSQQDIQSMKSFIDTNISSLKSSDAERNENMLFHLSTWKSNMDTIVNSLQQNVPLNKGRTNDESTSSFISPLEDFSVDKYTTITDWIDRNPPE